MIDRFYCFCKIEWEVYKSTNCKLKVFCLSLVFYEKQTNQQVNHLSLASRLVSSTDLMFLKSKWVSHLTPAVPSVQHFFSGVVVHHGVVAVQVCELYVGVPLFACLGVVSKVDSSGIVAIVVDTVNHSTDNKSIAHRAHWFCTKTIKRNALA